MVNLHPLTALQACLAGGWDVVAAHEARLPRDLAAAERGGHCLTLHRGRRLLRAGKGCRRFYVLLEVGSATRLRWSLPPTHAMRYILVYRV